MESNKKWGPWIVWGKHERPEGLRDDQRIQCMYVNGLGQIRTDGTDGNTDDRSVEGHNWELGVSGGSAITLAYRVQVGEKEVVLFGDMKGTSKAFSPCHHIWDTHKITLKLLGEEVVDISIVKI